MTSPEPTDYVWCSCGYHSTVFRSQQEYYCGNCDALVQNPNHQRNPLIFLSYSEQTEKSPIFWWDLPCKNTGKGRELLQHKYINSRQSTLQTSLNL